MPLPTGAPAVCSTHFRCLSSFHHQLKIHPPPRLGILSCCSPSYKSRGVKTQEKHVTEKTSRLAQRPGRGALSGFRVTLKPWGRQVFRARACELIGPALQASSAAAAGEQHVNERAWLCEKKALLTEAGSGLSLACGPQVAILCW